MTYAETQLHVGWDYNSDTKHLQAKHFVHVSGKYIDVWKKFTDTIGKKRKRGHGGYDSDDSDAEWAHLSGATMDKAMKKRCPMDIVGPVTYRLIESMNDPVLNSVLRVNANRSYVNNVGTTELSRVMFHSNTPSGMLLNLLTILLGRRNNRQRAISDEFDTIQRRVVSDDGYDAVDIQTALIDLCQVSLAGIDEPIDMVGAILKHIGSYPFGIY